MMLNKIKERLNIQYPQKSLLSWGYIVVGIYLFIAFLPWPKPIETGLDASWRYGISQAPLDSLIFGKDIIFTFGPLGYLIDGAFLEKNWIFILGFRWLVYSIFWIIAIIKILKLESIYQKFTLSFALILSMIVYFPTQIIHFPPDYQIAFIFFIFISFEDFLVKRNLRLWSLVVGFVAGFCLLTKLNLGIMILGAFTLFLLVKLYKALRKKTEISKIIFAITNTFIGSISISFIGLYSDDILTRFLKIILSLIIAILSVFLFRIFKNKGKIINLGFLDEKVSQSSSLKRDLNLFSWGIFYSVYSLLLVTIIIHSFPSLIDYWTNSLEIISGYSSAMSSLNPPRMLSLNFIILLLAIVDFFLILMVLILLSKEEKIGFSLALSLGLFLSFKHGFVRQDIEHIFYYGTMSLFVISLAIATLKNISAQKFAYLVLVYTTILVLLFNYSITNPKTVMLPGLKQLSPHSIFHKAFNFWDKVEEKSRQNLKKVQLPENVLNVVEGKTIDIIPWEISLVAANQLNWKPRPMLQSYSAYTTKLDHFNFESLSKTPRNYIFYNFMSIDGRHPFFDEPQTFAYVFCNYQPSSTLKDFINLPQLSKIILLEKRDSSRCSSPLEGETVSIPWNTSQPINVRDNTLIRASIKFQYSILGKIAKAIFRIPPVMMQVNYEDGSTQKYRIIPENSENGVIVSQLPRNDDEAMSFFQGNLPSPVKSFKFNPTNPLLYSPKIEMTFSSTVLTE